VERVLRTPPDKPYDLVLVDPPYAMSSDDVTSILAGLVDGWLEPDAMVVVERPRRAAALTWPKGLVGERERHYGETMLWYGQPTG
jgi:16S rRNA (guanine966-N2)-methyltransferase